MKMYDNILEKVRVYEEKRGITYAKPDGKLYKNVKLLYVLNFIYSLVMNLFFVISFFIFQEKKHDLQDFVYNALILSAGLIIALVLTIFKDKIIAALSSIVINAVSAVGIILNFAPISVATEGGYRASFYWKWLIPLCLLILFNLILNVIVVKATIKVQKTYKKIVNNIYATHHSSIEDGALDIDSWDEILKNI